MNDRVQHISEFHSSSLYFPTKTITIFGVIDEEMMATTIKNLHILDSTSGEVTIKISSNGGDVEAGLAIFDAIRNMKNEVRIIAYGGVSSMASVIFQAGDTRYMTKNSYLMIHEGESGTVGSKRDRKNWQRLLDLQETTCNNIYLEKIKIKKPKFSRAKFEEKFLQADTILTPEESIEFGLCDEIIEVY